VIVHVGIQVDHAGQHALGDHDIIKRVVMTDNFLVAEQFAIQQPAAANARLAAQCAFELGIQLIEGDGNQEPEVTQVDSQQRDLAPGHHTRC